MRLFRENLPPTNDSTKMGAEDSILLVLLAVFCGFPWKNILFVALNIGDLNQLISNQQMGLPRARGHTECVHPHAFGWKEYRGIEGIGMEWNSCHKIQGEEEERKVVSSSLQGKKSSEGRYYRRVNVSGKTSAIRDTFCSSLGLIHRDHTHGVCLSTAWHKNDPEQITT